MRRRIYLVGAAVAAASLAIGAGMAGAASTTAKKTKLKPITLHCNITLNTTPPAGQANVDQPPAQGNQYGPLGCRRKGFGSGVMEDSFTVPDSGDTVGTYTQYFHAGSISGAFDLTPSEGAPISSSNFASASWTGTLTVTGGTGLYKGIKMYKVKHKPVTPGVFNCTSPDSVHLTCTETVKVEMPLTNTLVSTKAS